MPAYAHPYKCGRKENRRKDGLSMTRAESAALTAACLARCGAADFGAQIDRQHKKRLAISSAAREGGHHA